MLPFARVFAIKIHKYMIKKCWKITVNVILWSIVFLAKI